MPDPTDAFGVPNPVVENTVDDVIGAFEQAKQRNENSLRLMSVASGSKPDAVGAYNTAKDKLGITGDFGDESTVSILHAELAKRNAEKEAALSQLATEYPGLYRLASRDRNAEVMYDDLPMLKMSYGGFQRYLRSANSLDDRPERSAVEAFGHGVQGAQRRFGLLALAIPALVTGDGSAARNAFYDLWDYDTANQKAGAAFKSKFTTDVAEVAGGFAGDPFTFVGMGAGAAASKVSIKTALKANAIVAYAQTTAAAYQDVSRDNMEKGNSPLLSPMQHTLAHLSGLVTGVLEKVSGPVGELALLQRGGGIAQAARSVVGGFVSEDLEESTQGLLESIAKGESLTLGDLAYQGFLGGVLGGVMGTPGAISQVMAAKAARDVVIPSAQVIEAVNGVQGIAEAEAALSQSRFAKRTTTRIKDLVAESLGPDQNIFVPRAAWTEVFTKHGLDPAAAAEKYEAIVSGDNLSIPAGSFIANRYFEQNQELKNDILNVVKVSETGLNMAGVDATIADIEKAAKEFTEQQQIEFADKLPDGKTVDDSAEVAEKITSDILSMKTPDGKKVDKLQAQHIGKIQSQFYRQMAIEFGKAGVAFTPKQMFERYPVGFGDGRGDLGQALNQGPVETDPAKTPMADTIEVDGVQRPTLNSNGKRIAQTEEAVRNFWKWFGDSKVVDERGLPLVVYHGTNNKFDVFRASGQGNLGPGMYFTPDKKGADAYARGRDPDMQAKPRIVEAYLKAENPLKIKDSNASSDEFYAKFPGETDADSVAALRKSGHDAVWAVGSAKTRWGSTTPEIVVFSPTQIKSAAGNRGTFDATDPSILNQAAPAGERGSYDPDTGTIDVSTSRDKSTLLHESAHHFLTVMEKLSTEQGAPDYFKEQFASFRKWIDDNADEVASSYNVREKSKLRTKPFVDVTADEIKATPFTDEGRKANFHAWAAQHEYFARGFESWVMEGKAPSTEVKSLFARFAAWLIKLYESIRALDVTMDEGSRRLMSRMLATDEMIAAANTEAFHREMTLEALKAKGIPDDMAKRLSTLDAAGQDAARAKMIERMARGIAKEDEAKHQAFRDKLVGELQAGEYRKDPLLAAAAAKSYIKGEGYLPGEDEAKINRQGVVFLLGETSPFVKLLEDAGVLTEKGQTPEDLASTFGAPDVGVFLEQMAIAPSMSSAVEKYVDAEEARILGPLMSKEDATKIAEEAAYGANRMQTAMAMAKVVLEKGKAVGKATTAIESKIDTEVLYHAQLPIALAMDPKNLNPTKWGRVANKFAKDALKALEKGEMEAFATAKQQEAAALVRRDIEQELKDSVKKADKVIAKYVDPNSKDRRELMGGDAAYVQAVDALLGAYGYKPDRPAFPSLAPMPVIAPGLASGPAPGRANTVGEVTDLADAIINIREAQKNVGKSVALAKGRELKAYGETLAKAAATNAPKKVPSKDSLANYSGKFFRLASKLSTYLAILDGGKPGVWTDVGDKLNKQSSVMESITKKYASQLEKDFYTTSTSNTRIGNTEYSMPMQNRITFAAHWGSESGRIRALEHLRTFIPGDPAKTEAARMRLAEQILASLDARHLDIVEKIWRINNEMTGETEAQHRRMGTIPPARIIESAYKVGDRVMQGGYMTVRWVDKPHAWSLEEVMNGVPTIDMMPGNSSEKARVKQVTGVLDLGMEVALGHIGEVARVLAFREVAADLYSLMNPSTGKVLGIIEQTHGGAWASDFYQSLSSAITGPPPPSNMLDRMAGHLRRNATAGGLLFNIFSAASQFMGVTSTVAEVGAKATATGMTEYATGPVEKHNWIKEKSELMRNRGGLFDANLHELYNYTKRFKFLGKIGRAGFVPIGFTQSIVDDITWLAAFRKAEAEYPGKTEAYHVARADQAVKNSQGAAADMDLTPLHQKHLARLLTLFGTPFTTMINQMQVATGTGDYKKLAATAFWTMSVTSILMAFLEALRGGGPEEDDYVAWFAKYHLETTLGLHPVTRAFTPSIMAGKLTTIPGTRAASAALGIPEDIYATATGEQDLTTTAKHAISGLPAIVPVPSAAMNRMVDAAIQIIEQDAPLQGARTLTLGSPPLTRK